MEKKTANQEEKARTKKQEQTYNKKSSKKEINKRNNSGEIQLIEDDMGNFYNYQPDYSRDF